MVYLNTHYCVPGLGDLSVNKVSVYFLRKLDLKTKNKSWVQLYLFGINGLSAYVRIRRLLAVEG